MVYRKFLIFCISALCLSGCYASYQDFKKDILATPPEPHTYYDDLGQHLPDGDIYIVKDNADGAPISLLPKKIFEKKLAPQEAPQKASKTLQQKEPKEEKFKDKQQLDTQENKEPEIEEAPQDIASQCDQRAFLKGKSISALYKIHREQDEICQEITDPAIAAIFMSIFAQRYDWQDIRLLNIDTDFVNLYINALKNSKNRHLKMLLKRNMQNRGCHLLSSDVCIAIKETLN